MTPPVDVTGRWVGHYGQFSQTHAIAADLVQTGARLAGTMADLTPKRERSVFEAAVEAGWPPGADEQIIAQLRELFPDAPRAPIRYLNEMPASSVLAGKVEGRSVSFLKTYEGELRSGYLVGDRFVGETIPRHAVHYEGRLSADSTEIEGKWWIPQDRERNARRLEGDFFLRRHDGT
jgi:hypothetical protein